MQWMTETDPEISQNLEPCEYRIIASRRYKAELCWQDSKLLEGISTRELS